MKHFIIQNWQAIITIFAFIVSVGSTLISYYTFRLQRIHNTKSVKPIIHVGQWDYENRLIVTLKNCGSGLAIIKRITVTNNHDETKSCIYDWLPKKLPAKMNYSEYWTGYKNFVVLPAETIELIKLTLEDSDSAQVKVREDIRAILRQLTVKIIYEDIYENKMEDKIVTLFIFSRHDNENSEDS